MKTHRSVWSGAGWTGLLVGLLLAGCVQIDESGFGPRMGSPDHRAWAVIDRWIAAAGGLPRIKQLTSMDLTADVKYGAAGRAIGMHVRALADGRYRNDFQSGPQRTYTQAFDGQFAWQSADHLGFGRLSADQQRENRIASDFVGQYRVGLNYPLVQAAPDEVVEGRTLHVLGLIDQLGFTVKWYFDPATGRRVRAVSQSRAGPIIEEYSDFRTADGVTEPYRTIRHSQGMRMELQVRHIAYNADFGSAVFRPPAGLVEADREIEDLLRRYRQTLGYDALHRVRTRVTKAVMEITTSGMKIALTTSQKQPNLIVTEQDVPGMGQMWSGYNGETGWAWSELEGFRKMQGDELAQCKSGATLEGPLRLGAMFPLRRLIKAKDGAGSSIQGVRFASTTGVAGDFYFDTVTGNLVREDSVATTGASGEIKVRVDFSDFRRVDGVMIPFVTTMTNPAVRSVTTIQSVVQNVPLDDAIFEPKKGD